MMGRQEVGCGDAHEWRESCSLGKAFFSLFVSVIHKIRIKVFITK